MYAQQQRMMFSGAKTRNDAPTLNEYSSGRWTETKVEPSSHHVVPNTYHGILMGFPESRLET